MTIFAPVHPGMRSGKSRRRAHDPFQTSLDVFDFLANPEASSPLPENAEAEPLTVAFTLRVDNLPRVYRPAVEELIAEYLPLAQGDSHAAGSPVALRPEELLDAPWFIRWQRADAPATVRCRETFHGLPTQVEGLRTAIAELSTFISTTHALSVRTSAAARATAGSGGAALEQVQTLSDAAEYLPHRLEVEVLEPGVLESEHCPG